MEGRGTSDLEPHAQTDDNQSNTPPPPVRKNTTASVTSEGLHQSAEHTPYASTPSLHLQRTQETGAATDGATASQAQPDELSEKTRPSVQASSPTRPCSEVTIDLAQTETQSDAQAVHDNDSEEENEDAGSFLADGSDDEDPDPRHVFWRKLKRWIPFLDRSWYALIGYNHVNMVFSAIAIVLLSLMIAGCSSNFMRNVYILAFSYRADDGDIAIPNTVLNPSLYDVVANVSSTGALEVRVGYFGFCIASASLDAINGWVCKRDAAILASRLNAAIDPLNLLAVAANFKDEVILSVIIIMATVLVFIGFYALGTFPGWHEEMDAEGSLLEVKPFPSNLTIQLVMGCHLIASLFLIVAVLWQHIASVAYAANTELILGGAVHIQIGAAAVGMGWGAVGATILVTVAMTVLFLNLRLVYYHSLE
ncbi:Ca2+ regulator and membrane fusion protein Fig1-domain-containing protein [Aspergillus multicolor]|uniref:Fig1 domain-containing protein n=1 Tax=Aspergillus multicolor TaxID=41759 RepID=UPI003CCE24D6